MFTVPPIGAGVWVEFEQGDPDYPIWVGGYCSAAEVPAMAQLVPPGRPGTHLPDPAAERDHRSATRPARPAASCIKTTTGAMISVSDVGITISNGKGAIITMIGPTVDINAGALTVI